MKFQFTVKYNLSLAAILSTTRIADAYWRLVGFVSPRNEDLVAYLGASKAFLVVTLIYNCLRSFSLIVLPIEGHRYGEPLHEKPFLPLIFLHAHVSAIWNSLSIKTREFLRIREDKKTNGRVNVCVCGRWRRPVVAYYNASVDERRSTFVTEARMCPGSPSVAR